MTKSIKEKEIANRILLAVSPAVFKQILPHLKPFELKRGHIVHRPGESVRDVYFVNRGLISLVMTMQDGRTVEVGTRGIESLTSPAALFGIDTAILESVVQVSASAFSIGTNLLRGIMAKNHTLNALLQGYVHLSTLQIAQTAACNRLHSLEERCCRWLLIAHDNSRSDKFFLTHEFLAAMLGVRRPGVSIAAAKMQKDGFIQYSNGRVTIIDRAGLEASACECYGVIRDQIDRLFGKQEQVAWKQS